MTHRIAVIPGDGAGPEVVAEARKAVDALGLGVEWNELPWGSAHFHETGAMMPADAIEVARGHDAVLLGAVGDPSVPDHVSLWGLLLPLRQGLDLWANIRPARLLEGVPSPLAGAPAVDMLFVRENTEGEYSGVGGRAHTGFPHEVGVETAVFTREGVRRVVTHAFELAEQRSGRLTSATKSNASRYGYVLWDEVVEEVAAEHPTCRSTARWSTPWPRGWSRTRSASTSSSPRTSSATCSPTSRRCSKAGWAWRRAQASLPAPARPRSSSRCTAPRRTSPARGWPTRSARSGAPR